LLPPPYRPHIEADDDIANIDKMFTKETPRETPEDESKLMA
jgi:hypothetical protein